MRMKKQIILWCILAALGLLGGGLGKMYLKPQAQEETAPAEEAPAVDNNTAETPQE